MSFYSFIIKKAAKYGHQCPHCGENDGFFALNGKCDLCQSPLIRYGKEQSLLFSLEVFIEFIDNYIDNASVFENKEIRNRLENIIIGLRESKPILDVEEFKEIQAIFRSGVELKGGITGGRMELNKNSTDTITYSDPKTTLSDENSHGVDGAIMAIQFIAVVRFKK